MNTHYRFMLCAALLTLVIHPFIAAPSISWAAELCRKASCGEPKQGVDTKATSKSLVLLPMPQKMLLHNAMHRLKPGRFIVLEGDSRDELLRTGKYIQESLAAIGPRWELTTARGTDPQRVGLLLQIAPSLVTHREGYSLSIGPDRIWIVAHDPAGAFYAAMTLRQIARQSTNTGELPCLNIEDWPDFSNRGVLLDISRDKVPTMETFYQLIDLLAEWKINQFQLNLEHTFAYRNHKEVWAGASPITGEQFLAMDAYCRERFIELVPFQQSFGHLNRWLKHPRYQHLAELPPGWKQAEMQEWWTVPWGLSPAEPGSLQLLDELYAELLPHFTSRQLHVGCDETWDLGRGKSKTLVEQRGVSRVYLDFLLRIYELARKNGRTIQFWADVILKHPELIPEVPHDAVAMIWGYEADHLYSEQCQLFAQAGIPFYVCPGTQTWLSIGGRTDKAIANLRNAAKNGLEHGAIGFLNCNWGDRGHWEHLPVSYLGYAYGAALGWAYQANHDLDLPRALDLHAFYDKAGVMGQLVYNLGNVEKETGLVRPGGYCAPTLTLTFPEDPISEGRLAPVTIEAFERASAYIDRVMAKLPEARMGRADAALIADELRNAAAMLRHACALGIARKKAVDEKYENIPADTRSALRTELKQILHDYRAIWLARNRQGGLDDSAGLLEKILELYGGD